MNNMKNANKNSQTPPIIDPERLSRDACQTALAYVHHWEASMGRLAAFSEARRHLSDAEARVIARALLIASKELGT